ncbi:uncharacterized protein LOC135398920 [Ornithodoros turicata]|uniref:Putative mitochondrial ribosomal protein s34 n=1 Tax=Ornithodoros turicata TaxID=34597 RepID=A0A2R5LH71_9ACAR
MPRIHYIGYPSRFHGKYLLWILGNLKDFGVGRVVTRSIFDRYPEQTYWIIKRVVPFMDPNNNYGDVWAEHVFRGRRIPGEILMQDSHLPDFRLVPKGEEHKLLGIPLDESPPKILPRERPFSPLLRMIIERDLRAKGVEPTKEPTMEAMYATSVAGVSRRAEEGETPTVDFANTKKFIFEKFRKGVVEI